MTIDWLDIALTSIIELVTTTNRIAFKPNMCCQAGQSINIINNKKLEEIVILLIKYYLLE
jgi:hypothetical protein